jgi:hypothetical protein
VHDDVGPDVDAAHALLLLVPERQPHGRPAFERLQAREIKIRQAARILQVVPEDEADVVAGFDVRILRITPLRRFASHTINMHGTVLFAQNCTP